jgi:hypothetical protein
MSRSAQEVLEFDKLRELLRQRTTCAPGRRAVEALEFSRDAQFLQKQFALVREAREWLRSGNELGFGGLADPEMWLEKIAGSGVALEAKEFLDAAKLRCGCACNFAKSPQNFHCLGNARRASAIFANCWRRFDDAFCRTGKSAMTLRLLCGEFA